MAHTRLLDQVRESARARRLAYRTEQAYIGWVKRFVRHFGMKHPREMGETEVTAFLSHLANHLNVAPATQNQALSALLFLYSHVLQRPLGNIDAVRAKKPKRLPVVLSSKEIERLLSKLKGEAWLQAALMYGAGLRLVECLRLRVKDLDFERLTINVYDGKGAKDRVTMLPEPAVERLRVHLAAVHVWYEQDRQRGTAAVHLPFALERNTRMPVPVGPGSGSSRRSVLPGTHVLV